MPVPSNLLKFLVLCLVWGLTWIATKVGIATVPPLLFASTRFVAAGLLVGLWIWRRTDFSVWRHEEVVRLFAVSLLMITLCYGPLFWGMRYASSGTAGVLEMSLTPLALLGFGIALREERWSKVNAIAIALGVAGLCLLFAPSIKTEEASGVWSVVGLTAIALAAISYAWGSVLARPLIARHGSEALSSATMLIGGLILLSGSLVGEPNSKQALLTLWSGPAIVGWLFLVIFGSLVGYSLYMQILRDLGPTKAGSFAFVSPIIAVVVGAVAAGEPVTLLSVVGMAVMLLAAGICLYGEAAQTRIFRTPFPDESAEKPVEYTEVVGTFVAQIVRRVHNSDTRSNGEPECLASIRRPGPRGLQQWAAAAPGNAGAPRLLPHLRARRQRQQI